MSLRCMVACDFSRITAETGGLGEAIVYTDSTGAAYDLTAIWTERPNDIENDQGIGAASTRSMATCRIALADVTDIDMRATITRVATDQDWVIEQSNLSTDIAWILTLQRSDETLPRGVK
jgi:hypothetical protein